MKDYPALMTSAEKELNESYENGVVEPPSWNRSTAGGPLPSARLITGSQRQEQLIIEAPGSRSVDHAALEQVLTCVTTT